MAKDPMSVIDEVVAVRATFHYRIMSENRGESRVVSANRGQGGQRLGFTLIELTIVLLVMGILAAIAVPRYLQTISRFRVEAAAKRVASDLNLARQNAMSTGGMSDSEWIEFTVNEEKYKLFGDFDLDRPSEEYEVKLSKTPYPARLFSAEFTNELGYVSSCIKFDMYGSARTGPAPAYDAARVVNGQIVVQSGGEQRTIVINPATGEASIQ